MRWLAKAFGTIHLEVDAFGRVTPYARLFDKDYEIPFTWHHVNEYEI